MPWQLVESGAKLPLCASTALSYCNATANILYSEKKRCRGSCLKVAPSLCEDTAQWPTPAYKEGLARPCAVRSADLAAWGPRGTP